MHKLRIILFLFFTFPCFSLYWGVSLEGEPTVSKIVHLENKMDVSFIQFYLSWPTFDNDDLSLFPQHALENIKNKNIVPIITWEPYTEWYQHKRNVLAKDIIQGKYDHYLQMMAHLCKRFDFPLIIRFAHEMNLKSYHWGEASMDDFGPFTTIYYKKMVRYIIDFFRNEKAYNVLFAFCPNHESVPTRLWNRFSLYYPGDDYIDIVGLDGYDWGECQSKTNESFEAIFSKPLKRLKKMAKNKPIIIFETATSQKNKKEWIQNAFKYAQKEHIEALIWFDINKECQWSFEWGDVPKTSNSIIPAYNWAQALLLKKHHKREE
jgi:beta-mannanase